MSNDARSEAEFRALVEAAPDGIVISRNGILLYVNPAAVALLGYDDASELLGKPMSIFQDEASSATMRRRLEQLRQTGVKLPPREYPARKRDGTEIVAEITSMFTEYEGAPAVLAFARDVTERVRLRALLAHADRLAALGVITAGVAHEINNPLAFMTLAAEMLARKVPPDGDARQLVSDILTGADRIAHIVRDLRIYARHEDEPATAVDLAEVIASAERIVAHEVAARARVRRELEALPAVLGAATRLEHVIVNLLLNAAFAIEETRTDGEIVLRARGSAGKVIVEVEDNGRGIEPENLSRIFEPFFTTRPSGTGLGLSICRDIVARFGGELVASSEPGKGTTMRMTLPEAREPATSEPTPPRAPLPPPSASSRKRVLVIDDEPLVVHMVKSVLDARHDVLGETDPRRGLATLLADPAIDVVLCDLMMPGLTGMDLHDQLARERPGLERRLVFATGGPFTPRTHEFLARVPNRRLSKPFSAAELEECVAATPAFVSS